EIVEQERRNELGPKQHLLIFVLTFVGGVVRHQRVLIVDRRQAGAVGGGVEEVAAANGVRLDDQVRRHRQGGEPPPRPRPPPAPRGGGQPMTSPKPHTGTRPQPARAGKKLQYESMSPATA